MDMSPFLSQIDFSSEVALVFYIASGLASLYVVAKGICMVLKMLTGTGVCTVESVARAAGDVKPPRNPRESDKVSSGKGGWC